MSSFTSAFPFILQHEGGFSCDPSDPGGATKYGISLYWLQKDQIHDPNGNLLGDVNHDGRIDINDIKCLTMDIAAAYYQKQWWDYYHFDQVSNQDVATKLFDTAVNIGGIPAIKLLQHSLNILGCSLLEDGRLGPRTVALTNAHDEKEVLGLYRKFQADHYRQLVLNNPSLTKFLTGWLNRAAF